MLHTCHVFSAAPYIPPNARVVLSDAAQRLPSTCHILPSRYSLPILSITRLVLPYAISGVLRVH
jgi:hypothetical protein